MSLEKLAKGLLKIGLIGTGIYIGVRFADEIKHGVTTIVEKTYSHQTHSNPKIQNAILLTTYVEGVYTYERKK